MTITHLCITIICILQFCALMSMENGKNIEIIENNQVVIPTYPFSATISSNPSNYTYVNYIIYQMPTNLDKIGIEKYGITFKSLLSERTEIVGRVFPVTIYATIYTIQINDTQLNSYNYLTNKKPFQPFLSMGSLLRRTSNITYYKV